MRISDDVPPEIAELLSGLALAAGGANVIMQLSRLPVGHGVATSTVESGRVDVHPIKRLRTTVSYLVIAMLGTPAERRAQLFGDLERERDALSHEVDNLRAFEREYRSRLKTYFSQQLEALETSTSADPSSSPAAGQDSGAASGGFAQPKRLRSVLGDDEG